MELVRSVGLWVKNAVLDVASLLRDPSAPGVVTLVLLVSLVVCIILFQLRVARRRVALNWLKTQIVSALQTSPSEQSIVVLNNAVDDPEDNTRRTVVAAWKEYSETLVPHEEGGKVILRNAVRPSTFFNLEDLHFTPGFWRIVPGLFVTIGLFLT